MERLEEFVVLADCLNFSKAAGMLYLTQPVLSRHINDLEQSLGVKLFVRDTHRVMLTPIGRLVAHEAGEALEAYHKAMRNIKVATDNLNGRLSVGFLGQAVRPFLSQFIHYLSATAKLEVDYTSSPELDTLIRLLDGDSLDLAFITHIDPERIKGVEIQWITNDPLYVAVQPGHALSGLASVSVAELSDAPLVAYNRETNPHTATFHEQLFRRHGAKMNVVRAVTNVESGLFYAGLGVGCFLIPRHLAVMARDLVLIPISDEDACVSLNLIWKKSNEKMAVKTFVSEFTSFYHDRFD